MNIKAYYSDSVESAIRQARVELGDDAILLDSKKSGPSERHLGLYEVRFVLSDAGTGEPATGGAPHGGRLRERRLSQPPSEVERVFRRAVWAGPVRPAPVRAPGPALAGREQAPAASHAAHAQPLERGELPAASSSASAAPAGGGFSPTAAPGGLGELSRGIEEIRRMLYSHTQTCYLPAGELLAQPLLARLYQELAANEVSPELAAQLVAGLTPAAEHGASRADLERDLLEKLAALVPVEPEVGTSHRGAPQIVALVGPTGAGKTTTLAKLAVRMGLERSRQVHLLSADNQRVGALHQIETYAEIFGVGCTALDGGAELGAVLDELCRGSTKTPRAGPAAHGAPDLVLIDTPGYGGGELAGAAGLAGFLRASEGIDTHLVLSASTKPRDLRRSIEEYSVFGPRKLLFTKLDETQTFGPLLQEAVRTGWPLSFLGVGQRIPEDLVAAGKAAVAKLVWTGKLPAGGL
ncbi:MAG TPA: hypothetical protein VEU62_09605 [Bryobacterales bacterium]|nr:hypothetical protein [Bryobacterales bacterium]